MSTGDVINPKRLRMQPNERLDSGDVDAASVSAREHIDAYARAIEAVPRNVGASTPTGFIFQGFGLTLNPTAPSDSKVRIGSPLGVAFDSNGRMLIKESGVQVDLTLPSGNSQIYAYFVETASDVTVRRTISVSAPFGEGPTTIATRLQSGVGFFTRAGDQTSIVASDVVNGATTPLCFLGVANTSAGVVTMTGYDATTAPNGSFVTNRVTSVVAPSSAPTANTNNGSIATMHGLVNAALWMVGQAIWKGSKNLTPSAANNFGAYVPPTVGLDGLFDCQSESTLTPITRYRDHQQNIRYLVDHNGYPGGQLSIIEENWADESATVHVEPTAGFKTAGSPTIKTTGSFAVQLLATGDAWAVPLNIPYNAIIKEITVFYASGNAANTVTATLNTISVGLGGFAPQVAKTITTLTTLAQSFTVMATPTSGHGPKQVNTAERLQLAFSCTITGGSVDIKDIQVTYALPPPNWRLGTASNVDDVTAGDNVTFDGPVAGFNQRSFHPVARGTGSQFDLIRVDEVYVDDNLCHVAEFSLLTGTVVDGPNQMLVFLGMELSSGDSWALNRLPGAANWHAVVQDDLGDQDVDTGVSFANSTLYRFKLDFQGKNRNSSGAGRLRVWINGALAATVPVTGGFTPNPAHLHFQVSAQGTSNGPYDLRIGRVRQVWNHRAAGDNV